MANETLNTILQNQNAYIRAGEAARNALDTKVTNAMRQLANDDTALSQINTKVTNAMSQLDNDDSALTNIENDVTSALAEFSRLANREYGYTHEAIVTDDLEKDYQDIITANPDLENVSAVGLLAILKDGDTVTAQGNRLFINGTEEQSDYSFSGENSENGIEVVKIWYFQNGESQLTLQENFDYIIISANVRQIETVNINASYLNYLNLITIDGGFVPSAKSIIKTVVDNYGINARLPKSVETYYSTRLQTGGSKNENTIFTNLDTTYKIKTVYLPELETISSTSFWQNQVIENIYCPKLKTIANSMWNADYYAPFSNCPNLIFTIPNSCEVISVSVSVNGNSSCFYESIKGIILDCKDAVISDLWCQSLSSISIFEMCSDWGASINISKPAGLAKWSMTKYIDLMTNKLRDMTVTEKTRTLTIPLAMLTAMQADTDGLAAIEAATDKSWTIGGA